VIGVVNEERAAMSGQASSQNGEATASHEVDVLVIGSGASGMASALTAKAEGLDVLIIEKSDLFGGSTAMSGGGVWVPNAPALERAGVHDDPARTLKYLETIAGDKVARERLVKYLDESPKLMAFLESQGQHLADGFFWIRGYSDYHPDRGGQPDGRGLWASPIDKRVLGEDIKRLRPGNKRMQLPLGSWMTSSDVRDLMAMRWPGIRGKRMLLKLAWRIARARLLGERIATSGQALATRLWLTVHEKQIPVWMETPMTSLARDGDTVVGAQVTRDGKPMLIRARHGVIVATGGFDHNREMRAKYQPEIVDDWSSGSRANLGDGILAGQEIGAALDLMDDAWWMPSVRFGDGTLFSLVAERQFPGQFIVNGNGERFINESAPYTDFGHAQIEGQRTGVQHIPAWMIFDDHAWKHNLICGHVPGTPMPKSWLSSDMVHKGTSLADLASRINVPAVALQATADRFNGYVRAGRDEDFHRGETAYDRFYGDHSYPNPSLAEVKKAPFYALAIVPGDLGTKGGMLTDEHARVLREDGTPIPHLYAAGNASSSVMGNDYAGPGATLGPAMTFGYVAARHIAAAKDAGAGDAVAGGALARG
jgi:3-oxosteroid 1-dehydrogenase